MKAGPGLVGTFQSLKLNHSLEKKKLGLLKGVTVDFQRLMLMFDLNDSVPLEADNPLDGADNGADLVHHLHVDGELGIKNLIWSHLLNIFNKLIPILTVIRRM